MIEAEIPNLKLLNVDAADLTQYFEKGEVSRVYLNFSDPWPKNRHEKRRLTYKSFLRMYEEILPEKEKSILKPIIKVYLNTHLMSFSAYGLLLKYVSLDLHKVSLKEIS